MDIKSLRYFLRVADTGSFLATARELNVPVSSVSRFVAGLEKELGQQLLYRNTRSVSLTEAGMRFHSRVRDALEILDEAAQDVAAKSYEMKGNLTINAPLSLGKIHFSPLIGRLQNEFPHLNVEMTLTDAFIDPVREGIDITVRVGRLADSNLVGRAIARQKFLLAASPCYLARFGVPVSLNDLKDHNCLLYKGDYGLQKWYFRDADSLFEEASVQGSFQSNNAETLVDAAIEGRGLVLLPAWMFSVETFERGLLLRLFKDVEVSATRYESSIHLLTPENRLRSHRVREVSRFIVEQIGDPPYWDSVLQVDGTQNQKSGQ